MVSSHARSSSSSRDRRPWPSSLPSGPLRHVLRECSSSITPPHRHEPRLAPCARTASTDATSVPWLRLSERSGRMRWNSGPGYEICVGSVQFLDASERSRQEWGVVYPALPQSSLLL